MTAPMQAVIFGLAGARLSDGERDFLRDCPPWGLILFGRNCHDRDQIRALIADVKAALGRDHLPVLIDQEGGRVSRMAEPQWRRPPPPRLLTMAYARDEAAGVRASYAAHRLIAAMLHEVGVNVDCAPMVDWVRPDAHAFLQDRALGETPDAVIALAAAAVDGLMDGGVAPVIKHAPGHGLANADSHKALPVIEADLETLRAHDFKPFRAFCDTAMMMTGHLLIPALDPGAPTTMSAPIIDTIIRGDIGFDGLLMTDDLNMEALEGPLDARAQRCLDAGCDVVLQCNGEMTDMQAVARGVRPLAGDAARRAETAFAATQGTPKPADLDALQDELDALLAGLTPTKTAYA